MNRFENTATSIFGFNANWPKLETPKLKMSDKFRWPIFIILGFILSLWSNCLLVICITGRYIHTVDLLLIITGFITHVIISLATFGWLTTGLKQKDPDFLIPWMVLKGIELLGLFASVIFPNPSTYGLIPVAVIFIIIGVYLLTCLYATWREMKKDLLSNPTLNIPTSDSEKPPSYESFTNQTNVV